MFNGSLRFARCSAPTETSPIDFHGRVSSPMARRLLPLLEPLQPMFVEEPILPEYGANLASIVEHVASRSLPANGSTPAGTSGRPWRPASPWRSRTSPTPVASPRCGGSRRRPRLHDVYIAPHCPLGPIALAACLQVDFTIPNLLIQEQSLGIHYNGPGSDLLDYLVDPPTFDYRDGWVERPLRPGLGMALDEKAIEDAAAWAIEHDHVWRTPVWRHEDGSLAEW